MQYITSGSGALDDLLNDENGAKVKVQASFWGADPAQRTYAEFEK